MKRLVLILSLLSTLAFGAEGDPPPPQTVEIPFSVYQEIFQFLVMDRGKLAVSIARDMDDCAKNQGPVTMHIGGQVDLCPAVTSAMKSRADTQAKAISDAVEAAKKAP